MSRFVSSKGAARSLAAVTVAMALWATACGGEDTGGLATLVGTTSESAASDTADRATADRGTDTTSSADEQGTSSQDESSTSDDDLSQGSGAADGLQAAPSIEDTPSTTADANAADATDSGDGDPEAAEQQVTVSDDLSDEEYLLEFAECMRSNGVEFPDPVIEADGTVSFGLRPGAGAGGAETADRLQSIGRDPDLPAAREACEPILENVALGFGRGGFDQTELQDTLLEFAQCMRDNGIDMGDPDLSEFGPGRGDNEGGVRFQPIDFDDPDVQAAFDICQAEVALPGPPGGAAPRPGGQR